eukprot:gene10683-biopygen15356
MWWPTRAPLPRPPPPAVKCSPPSPSPTRGTAPTGVRRGSSSAGRRSGRPDFRTRWRYSAYVCGGGGGGGGGGAFQVHTFTKHLPCPRHWPWRFAPFPRPWVSNGWPHTGRSPLSLPPPGSRFHLPRLPPPGLRFHHRGYPRRGRGFTTEATPAGVEKRPRPRPARVRSASICPPAVKSPPSPMSTFECSRVVCLAPQRALVVEVLLRQVRWGEGGAGRRNVRRRIPPPRGEVEPPLPPGLLPEPIHIVGPHFARAGCGSHRGAIPQKEENVPKKRATGEIVKTLTPPATPTHRPPISRGAVVRHARGPTVKGGRAPRSQIPSGQLQREYADFHQRWWIPARVEGERLYPVVTSGLADFCSFQRRPGYPGTPKEHGSTANKQPQTIQTRAIVHVEVPALRPAPGAGIFFCAVRGQPGQVESARPEAGGPTRRRPVRPAGSGEDKRRRLGPRLGREQWAGSTLTLPGVKSVERDHSDPAKKTPLLIGTWVGGCNKNGSRNAHPDPLDLTNPPTHIPQRPGRSGRPGQRAQYQCVPSPIGNRVGCGAAGAAPLGGQSPQSRAYNTDGN